MLDFIGYTTAPEDFEGIQQKMPDALEWLFSTPWWVPSLFMLALLCVVIWGLWPQKAVLSTVHEALAGNNEDDEKVGASLKLFYPEDEFNPDYLSHENIFRYYSLTEGNHTFLFLTFKKPVTSRYYKIRFIGEHKPSYAVKDSTERSAVILISGSIKKTTVDIKIGA